MTKCRILRHPGVKDDLSDTAMLIAELYGPDLEWLTGENLTGKPDRPYRWAPHRSLNSQRGDGWPLSPVVDIPQIEWTPERDLNWPSNE